MVDIFLEICSIENRCVGQSGSALRSVRRGRWFESSHPDIFKKLSVLLGAFFMGLRPHKSPRTEVHAAAVPPLVMEGVVRCLGDGPVGQLIFGRRVGWRATGSRGNGLR